jgi:hypothetical protein
MHNQHIMLIFKYLFQKNCFGTSLALLWPNELLC